MSTREQLNSYIEHLERRLRLGAVLRGVAILTGAGLGTTVILVLIINLFAFSKGSVTGARVVLLSALAVAVSFGLAIPLSRLNRRRAVGKAESVFPQFQQRLVTFVERDRKGEEPFIELLAADTLATARRTEPALLFPQNKLAVALGAGIVSVGVLIWMVLAGPGYLGYGAALLWTGPHVGTAPFYDIHVSPGDATVRRRADQLVTALPVGVETDKVRLYARYQSASRWEQVAMQPQPGASGFQFLFAALPEGVEYYVEAGAVRSRHFHIHVVDMPSVKQIRVNYRFPAWTRLQNVVEGRGGDLRAVEGTDAELEILMDRPLRDGVLVLDNDQQIRLTGGEGNLYRGTVHMEKDGMYHVAALDQGQPVRLSEDFFIEANKAKPPEVQIARPGRDYRASPIEEVTVSVKAQDEFGLDELNLHYSVNGGAEQSVSMLKRKGGKQADGSATLYLENFKMVPGDVVSLYATAKDARSESRTDMFFVQADPFEREFSQSQQSGGGGGGGGGGGLGDQTDIAQREKEIIAATWKQQGNRQTSKQEVAEAGKFLSEVQSKLADQARSLSFRMQSRELSEANDEFTGFVKDMNAAAEAMAPASAKLKQLKWNDAIPNEQKALQHLLRAEATFRQIQVAFGAAGGGAGGGGAGRDLASLFDLELDTEKNQYETAQSAGSANQRAEEIDDALKKLDELARREEELAEQQRNQSAQSFEQRWEQEMLRRDAEELQKQIEQLARNNQQGQQGAAGSSSQSSTGQSNGSASEGSSDPRAQQALDRLRQASDDMRRAASQQQSEAEARRAADRLREATNLLGGMQQQQASGRLDSMARESDRLLSEERDQAGRLRELGGQQGSPASGQGQLDPRQEQSKLADDRQHLADDLSRLQKQMRDAEHELASSQRPASSKLRDALGEMEQNDLETRVQKTADWLRRGINPNSNATESEIGHGLERLSEQMRQAQQALGSGGQQQGAETAVDRLERLRNQLEALDPNGGGRDAQGRQRGGQGLGGQPGQPGGGGQFGPIDRFGEVRGGGDRNGQRGYWGVDTGNNSNLPHPVAPDNSPMPPDPERVYQQGLGELNQLRQSVANDPETLREVQELIREMQRLDPSRFPGNPALVEQLHTQVLSDVDKLELKLRRQQDDGQSGQIRSSDPLPMPSGYQDAVAEYFRRLSRRP
jgi:hypothetical protein